MLRVDEGRAGFKLAGCKVGRPSSWAVGLHPVRYQIFIRLKNDIRRRQHPLASRAWSPTDEWNGWKLTDKPLVDEPFSHHFGSTTDGCLPYSNSLQFFRRADSACASVLVIWWNLLDLIAQSVSVHGFFHTGLWLTCSDKRRCVNAYFGIVRPNRSPAPERFYTLYGIKQI